YFTYYSQAAHKNEIIKEWHSALCEKRNNGSRAKLKRCKSPENAMMLRETHALFDEMQKYYVSPEAVATMAGILSHVKVNKLGKFAEKLGQEKGGHVLFSEIRFRNMLACRDWNEFYTSLRRAVVLLDGDVDPLSIVEAIKLWDEDKRGKIKEPSKKFCFKLSNEYYLQPSKTKK
ncbi:MAG: type I-E CRISPR-associated protein Cse2/CasB, partial [Fibrobacter sp.]|nr:type I-E CRISPR-associated protein Cse2/CasB [Fibrobacter sp.]